MSEQYNAASMQGDELDLRDLPMLRGQFVQGYQAGRSDGETVFKYHQEEETELELTAYLWDWMREPALAIPWRVGYVFGFIEADTARRTAAGLGQLVNLGVQK